MATLTTRVRQDLPVMSKGVALGEIANDNGDEGEAEGASDGDEGVVMGSLPGAFGDSF